MRSLIRSIFVLLLLCLLATAGHAQSTDAQCTVTFDAVWSNDTHPIDFPPDPHFSGLIGGTHDDLTVFWRPGSLATAGIQSVAETGSKVLFRGEVEDAIASGFAGEVISGGGISLSPGSVGDSFDIQLAFPNVTVVTMIAPSPDWFVGVDSLPLFQDGHWVEQLVVNLPAWDAGTDSGSSFTSLDLPTLPPDVIAQITNNPFPGGTSLGTFTFECTSTLVFTDGFESGDFASWSAVSP